MPIYSNEEMARIADLEAEIAPLEQELTNCRGSPKEAAIKARLLGKLKEYNAALDKQQTPTIITQ